VAYPEGLRVGLRSEAAIGLRLLALSDGPAMLTTTTGFAAKQTSSPDKHERTLDRGLVPRWQAVLANAARASGDPLLFGLRLWATVCLPLYVAFWLQLDNPYWAATSAGVVCQPHLGASMRNRVLEALAEGKSATATAGLEELGRHLTLLSRSHAEVSAALRARGQILAISDTLVQHRSYFGAGAAT
jgi:hypothetical protein